MITPQGNPVAVRSHSPFSTKLQPQVSTNLPPYRFASSRHFIQMESYIMWPSVSDFFTSHDVLKACHCWNMYQSVPPSLFWPHNIPLHGYHQLANSGVYVRSIFYFWVDFCVGCELRAWVFSAHRCPAAPAYLLESLPLLHWEIK